MKHLKIIIITFLVIAGCNACQKTIYSNNGESIYRSGRNQQGELMLDKSRSSITIFRSCQACHGPAGDRMKHSFISYKALSNPGLYATPYNDSSLIRFLDHDLKSDGSKADIGVRWKMSDHDKKDLVKYLKEL